MRGHGSDPASSLPAGRRVLTAIPTARRLQRSALLQRRGRHRHVATGAWGSRWMAPVGAGC
jgi:hypothetical protein